MNRDALASTHQPTIGRIELEGTEAEDVAPRAHRRQIMPKRPRLMRHLDQNVCKSCTLNAQSPRSSEHVRRATRYMHRNTGKRLGFTGHTSAHIRKETRPTGQDDPQTAKVTRRTARTTAPTSNSYVRPVHRTARIAKWRGRTAHATAQTMNRDALTPPMTTPIVKTPGQTLARVSPGASPFDASDELDRRRPTGPRTRDFLKCDSRRVHRRCAGRARSGGAGSETT